MNDVLNYFEQPSDANTRDNVAQLGGTVNLAGTTNASNASSGLWTLSTYADNAAALAGGLVVKNLYKTATGEVRIVV